MKAVSLYIHVPFCKRRCAYCTFYHVPYVDRFEERFVESLVAEFRAAVGDAGGDLRLPTVFVGGGTPSVLSPSSLERIFEVVAPCIAADAEVTVEANPEDVDDAVLDHLASLGVNRISLGVQSMVPRALRVLMRCGAEVNARAIELVARHFDNFNIDLVLGVPGGSLEEVAQTLGQLSDSQATHYSVYCLEPGGVLTTPDIERFFDGVDTDLSAEEYLHVCDVLAGRGFDHYEVSNFARSGCQSRHNRVYWRGGDYLGIGPGAHSYIDSERYYNEPSIERYTAGDSPPRTHEARGAEVRHTEAMMLALRTSDGLDVAGAACATAVIDDLVDSALARRARNGKLVLTDRGFLLLNEILMRLSRAA